MSAIQKILVAILLFTAWGGMVLIGKTPVDSFVVALRDALLALGVFTATVSNTKE